MSFFDVTLITEPLITVCKILSAVCVKYDKDAPPLRAAERMREA